MSSKKNFNFNNSPIGIFNNVEGDLHTKGSLVENSASEGDIQNQHGKSSSGSEISQSQDLENIVLEVRQLLVSITKDNPMLETASDVDKQLAVYQGFAQNVEENPKFSSRLLHALKAGGIDALKEFLNHPLSSFVIGFLEDWKKMHD